MKETVNIDFIGVVLMKESGLLEYRRWPIPKLYDVELKELKAMCENDNRTIMDMQDHFKRFMPKSRSRQSYEFFDSYAYSSAYVDVITYPKLYSLEEIQTELSNIESSETINFLAQKEVDDISKLSDGVRLHLNYIIDEAKKAFNKTIKHDFIRQAYLYLSAYRYYKELKKIKADDRIKMYSTENIGWTEFSYSISDDIRFTMKSNFGYGRSSYLFINLTYKGIDILPFSDLVKYYYVDVIEFCKFTRQYIPSHENWEVALNFVVDTANLAIQNETAFVQKWIANEIDELVERLRVIASDPEKCITEFMKDIRKEKLLLHVRYAFNKEKNDFYAYREEATIAFQAEKLTSALNLIEKLQALAPTYPKVLKAIEQIKSMNIDLLPGIKSLSQQIVKKIINHQYILKRKKQERESLEIKLTPHREAIKALIEASVKDKNYSEDKIQECYIKSHPEFKELKDKFDKLSGEILNVENQISKRKHFAGKLKEYANRITKKLDL